MTVGNVRGDGGPPIHSLCKDSGRRPSEPCYMSPDNCGSLPIKPSGATT